MSIDIKKNFKLPENMLSSAVQLAAQGNSQAAMQRIEENFDLNSEQKARIFAILQETNAVPHDAPKFQRNIVAILNTDYICFKNNTKSDLSNNSPHGIELNGRKYYTAAVGFCAVFYADQPEVLDLLVKCINSSQAEKIMEQHPMTSASESMWQQPSKSTEAMMTVLRAKFGFDEELKKILLATGAAELICEEEHPYNEGQGKNLLGKCLMQLRAEYYNESLSLLSCLPKDIEPMVFQGFSPEDMVRYAQTCKSCHKYVTSRQSFWSSLCASNFIVEDRSLSPYQNYQKIPIIDHNLAHQKYDLYELLPKNSEDEISGLSFCEDKLLFYSRKGSSRETQLHIFDMKTQKKSTVSVPSLGKFDHCFKATSIALSNQQLLIKYRSYYDCTNDAIRSYQFEKTDDENMQLSIQWTSGQIKNMLGKNNIAILNNEIILEPDFNENQIEVLDLNTGKHLRNLIHGNNDIRSVVVLQNKHLVSGCSEGEVKIWDSKNENCEATLSVEDHFFSTVNFIAATSDGNLLVAYDSPRDIVIWNPNTLTTLRTFKDYGADIYSKCIGVIIRNTLVTANLKWSDGVDAMEASWSCRSLKTGELLGDFKSIGSMDKVIAQGGKLYFLPSSRTKTTNISVMSFEGGA